MSSEFEGLKLPENASAATDAARGTLIVVSSPSGGGKGTIIRRVLQEVPDLSYSVSFTTRQPRAGEQHGREYFFVSVDEFEKLIAANQFIEWARVHGNLYGTAHKQVEREIAAGRDIILEIDVQGAQNVRALIKEAVGIFILPPSFEVLQRRLTGRGSEIPDHLALRLRNARAEVLRYSEFDYVIVNDEAERAAKQLAAIVYAERVRRVRQEQVARRIIATFPVEPAAS